MDLLIENPGLQHIGLQILEQLDVQSLENCRWVCQSWKYLIDTSEDLQYTVYTEELYRISDEHERLFDFWPQWFQMFEDFISKKPLEDLKYFTQFINNYLYHCKSIKKESPFHYAAKFGDLELIEFLCENMTDFNTKSKLHDGATGFLIAAKCGHDNVVKYLIESSDYVNINLNATDDFGQSAYVWAMMRGRKKVMEVLKLYPQIRKR